MRGLLMLAMAALVLMGANGCLLLVPGPAVYYPPEPLFDTWLWVGPGFWPYYDCAPHGGRPHPGRYPGRYHGRPHHGYRR